jgi:hypothetical protein
VRLRSVEVSRCVVVVVVVVEDDGGVVPIRMYA